MSLDHRATGILTIKTVKKELQGECRKVYSNYINNLVSEDDSPTSKKLWSFIKKQKCDYCGVASLEGCGSIHNEPQEKADILSGGSRGVARGAVAPPSCYLRKYKIMNALT